MKEIICKSCEHFFYNSFAELYSCCSYLTCNRDIEWCDFYDMSIETIKQKMDNIENCEQYVKED